MREHAQSRSPVQLLFATPWTAAHQAPLSIGFPRQESWSGLSFLPPGDLSNPGIQPMVPMSPALQGDFFFFFFTAELSGSPVPGTYMLSNDF